MKVLEKFLKSDGFKHTTHSNSWNKGNTRVYFEDNTVHVLRFNNPKSQLIEWHNIIDGNMSIEAIESIIFTMARV